MTEQEAINYLKHNCRRMCQDCYPEIGRGGSENCDFCNEALAYDVAIQALEKQIPRKPQKLVGVCGGEYCKCDCNHEFDYNSPYCPHCGQAIDWSDNNDY